MKKLYSVQLRQERELRGWPRVYIAEQVGVDIATVGRWERGECLPHSHYRQKLCMLFDKNAQDLGLLTDMAEEANNLEDLQVYAMDVQETTIQQVSQTTVPVDTTKNFFSFFNIYTDKSANTATYLKSEHNRQRMLKKMHSFWIHGVLEQSLHEAHLIELEFKEQHDAVADPWMLSWQQPEVVSHVLMTGMHISQIYDQVDGELLILGEPGSGKTTQLLELARILLNRAAQDESHPIPVIFNLASWAIKRQSLSTWFTEELHIKYQIPHKLAQAWVQTEQILPLLDGLDETPKAARSTCIKAINAYRQEHGLLPMIVCSRLADYFAQNSRLLLRRAVTVQPLSIRQIDTYFNSAGDKFAALHAALQRNASLQKLATSPLMLSILILTYRDQAIKTRPEPLPLEDQRQKIYALYIECMLAHRKGSSRYTATQTVHWLGWLARKLVQQQQSEFYLESMQPQWLLDHRALRVYCRLLSGLLIGLLGGVTAMLADVSFAEIVHKQLYILFTHATVTNLQCADTLPAFTSIPAFLSALLTLPIIGLLYGVGLGLIGGLASGLLIRNISQPRSAKTPTRASRLYQYIAASLFGLGCGSIFMLINLCWVPCPLPHGFYNQVAEELSYGLTGIFIGGLSGSLFGVRQMQIQPVEALVWTHIPGHRRRIAWQLGGIAGLLVGIGTNLFSEVYLNFNHWLNHLLISALAGGLLGIFIGWGIGGFSQHTVEKCHLVTPNEGMIRSARNGLLIGLPIGLTLTLFSLGLTLWLIPTNISDGLLWCLPFGFIVTIILILLYGGYAYLQQMVLRFILSCQGHIPWNYARFLDEAAAKLLLRKVGGGYMFMHHSLRDYFAEQITSSRQETTTYVSQEATP